MQTIHDSAERKLAEELTREVIAETAPEEMADFDRILAEYYRDPSAGQGTPRSGDDPLGFGMDSGLLTLSTPLVMSIATQVIAYFRTEVLTLAKDEAAASIRQKIRAFLQSASKEQPPGGAAAPESSPGMDFSRDQLLKIQKIARSEAERRGASKEEAAQLANSLIGRLAVAGP